MDSIQKLHLPIHVQNLARPTFQAGLLLHWHRKLSICQPYIRNNVEASDPYR